jgi:hypothetical protein
MSCSGNLDPPYAQGGEELTRYRFGTMGVGEEGGGARGDDTPYGELAASHFDRLEGVWGNGMEAQELLGIGRIGGTGESGVTWRFAPL